MIESGPQCQMPLCHNPMEGGGPFELIRVNGKPRIVCVRCALDYEKKAR